MTDVHTKEQRHKNMAAIRAKNTKLEIIVRKVSLKRGRLHCQMHLMYIKHPH